MTTNNDYKFLLSGGLAGLVEISLTHPLDYIKTKRQEFLHKNMSTNHFYQKIYNGNIRNLYKGISSRLIGIIPMRMIYWGSQGYTRDYLDRNKMKSKYNFFIIGTVGGSCQTIIDNQIEVVKVSKMLDKKLTLKDLSKFNGFLPTLYRNVIFANVLALFCFNSREYNNIEKFAYSAIGGALGSLFSQPFDYAKTITQSGLDNRSTLAIISDGNLSFNKLFAGGLSRAILGFCSMGIGFLSYDSILKLL